MIGGLGGPEGLAAQAFNSKLMTEFFDAVFEIGAAIVPAPDIQSVESDSRQIGDQSLEPIRWHLQEHLATGLRPFCYFLADDDHPICGSGTWYFLHLQAGHLGVTPRAVVVPAQTLQIAFQRYGHDIVQAFGADGIQELMTVEAAVGTNQADPDMGGQSGESAGQKFRSVVHAGRISSSQPKVGHRLSFCQRRDQGAMAGLQSLPGITDAQPFLPAVLMQKCPGIQVQGISCRFTGQPAHRPTIKPRQLLAASRTKRGEKSRERRLAWNGLNAQNLGDRRIVSQVSHSRQLVCTRQDPGQKPQRRIGRFISIVADGLVRKHSPQLRAKRALMQELRPNHHPAMRRQALIGKRNPHRLRAVRRANLHSHRLVRLMPRLRNLDFHTLIPPNGALLSTESFRLSLVKKTTGMTTAEPIAKGSSLPALTPIEIDPHKLLRVTDDFEKRLAEILTDISSRVGAKLAQVGRRCLIQVGYSEALDNGENMFGDYLYIRVRLFPSR